MFVKILPVILQIIFCGAPLVFAAPPPTGAPAPKYLHLVRSMAGANIFSPKSVIFSPDGAKFYVNSLEGMKTVAFSTATLQELGVISHQFGEADHWLFRGQDNLFNYCYLSQPPRGNNNCFAGKPVESVFTHDGRYLWVSYYRRHWDKAATSPSAVAVIDTATRLPVRIMPTGTIPKMLAVSPDNKTLAVIHWGDNSIGLIDISSKNPANFHYRGYLVDGQVLPLETVSGNRDANCGHCLRGAVFTADSRYLLVGRMRGSGTISVFDVARNKKIGALTGIPPTPRHLVLSADGRKLFASSSYNGMVSEIDINDAIERLLASQNGSVPANAKTLFVGKGARTLALSPCGKYLFVVCNTESKLIMVDIDSWRIIDSAPVSPYAVGLAVSPRGGMLVTTSQGKDGKGGHRIDIFRVDLPQLD